MLLLNKFSIAELVGNEERELNDDDDDDDEDEEDEIEDDNAEEEFDAYEELDLVNSSLLFVVQYSKSFELILFVSLVLYHASFIFPFLFSFAGWRGWQLTSATRFMYPSRNTLLVLFLIDGRCGDYAVKYLKSCPSMD